MSRYEGETPGSTAAVQVLSQGLAMIGGLFEVECMMAFPDISGSRPSITEYHFPAFD